MIKEQEAERSAHKPLVESSRPACRNSAARQGFGAQNLQSRYMKTLMLWIGWCLLFVICWPVAILALVLFPFVWLISLPLRLLGITLQAVFQLFRAILFFPARLLGATTKY